MKHSFSYNSYNVYKASMSSLLRFIKTLVVHLTAQQALERFCFRTRDLDVKISFFAVEQSNLFIPAGSWQKMKEILREAFSSDPSKSSTSAPAGDAVTAVDKAIKLLEDKILTPPEECGGKRRAVFANFESIIQDKPVDLPGGMHCQCETLLATLGRYFNKCLCLEEEDANLNHLVSSLLI